MILTGCMGETSWKEFWFWIIFSLFFPVSVVIWNIWHALKGPNHFKKYISRFHFLRFKNMCHRESIKAQAKVLNSISTLTKVIH